MQRAHERAHTHAHTHSVGSVSLENLNIVSFPSALSVFPEKYSHISFMYLSAPTLHSQIRQWIFRENQESPTIEYIPFVLCFMSTFITLSVYTIIFNPRDTTTQGDK